MDIPAPGVRRVPLFQNSDGAVSGYPRWLQDWGFGPELLSPEEIVSPAQDFPRSVINLSFWSYFFGLVIMFIRSVIKHLLISVESNSAGN